ncbi:TPA: hypothetical protein GND40_002737 [Salmonella enterica subsp. indica]|uniref:Uncharacterized protein n=2 Tax=Salmonella enterica TaxID=28901 RepID=A0A753A672_SALER|nr:hypothetical protein [Salmonella enterica subsp. indica serovar 45:a:e,n,x]HAE8102367.1 hypothetical protein [Salmonella enterica subsp. indica serovar 45:a:e,n,x]HAF7946786.1 hypothetical protein [Salmonella enterica subsp. indica]
MKTSNLKLSPDVEVALEDIGSVIEDRYSSGKHLSRLMRKFWATSA